MSFCLYFGLDLRLLDLNSERCVTKLLLSVDFGKLGWGSLDSNLLHKGFSELGHFIEFKEEESRGDELDGQTHHTSWDRSSLAHAAHVERGCTLSKLIVALDPFCP